MSNVLGKPVWMCTGINQRVILYCMITDYRIITVYCWDRIRLTCASCCQPSLRSYCINTLTSFTMNAGQIIVYEYNISISVQKQTLKHFDQRWQRLASRVVQTDYPTRIHDVSHFQQWLWSYCADMQADLRLSWWNVTWLLSICLGSMSKYIP